MAIEILATAGYSGWTAAADLVAVAISRSAALSPLAVLCRCGDVLGLLIAVAAGAISIAGVFRCYGRAARDLSSACIDEQRHPCSEERQEPEKSTSDWDVEITIRLEDSFLPTLHRHRCIATIRRPVDGAQDTGCEVWYARDEQ